MQPLAAVNAKFELDRTLPGDQIWHEWLWGTDPEESCHVDVLFNRNHLLGLLVCRYKHEVLSKFQDRAASDFAQLHRMTIMDKPIANMTWREMKDTIANILFEWPSFLDKLSKTIRFKQGVNRVSALVDECAGRFGFFAMTPCDETVMDDCSESQQCFQREFADKVMPTPAAMKRMVGSFLILYRHIYLLAASNKAPRAPKPLSISKYNYEASMDQFNLLCMHISLPVAARLTYRHDFPGMYNHVSQVVYFHNSEYHRIPRHPISDMDNAPVVHVLPAVQELYPEIPLRFEEDSYDPTKPGGWYWLLIAGRVYLITPAPRVIYSDRLSDMLQVYLESSALPSVS